MSTSVDEHPLFAGLLTALAAARGLAAQIDAVVADMADPGLAPASVDLVWSEGALYNVGFDVLEHFPLPRTAWWDEFFVARPREGARA